jgi:hypothetical protein
MLSSFLPHGAPQHGPAPAAQTPTRRPAALAAPQLSVRKETSLLHSLECHGAAMGWETPQSMINHSVLRSKTGDIVGMKLINHGLMFIVVSKDFNYQNREYINHNN